MKKNDKSNLKQHNSKWIPIGLLISIIGVILFFIIKYNADQAGFDRVRDKFFGYLLSYGLLLAIIIKISYIVKFWCSYYKEKIGTTVKSGIREGKTKDSSLFIRISCDIFVIVYLFGFLIYISKTTRFLKILYRLKYIDRWLMLLCILIIFAMMIYCCFVQHIPEVGYGHKDVSAAEVNYYKQVIVNNQDRTIGCMVSTILLCLFCNGLCWDKKAILLIFSVSLVLTLLQIVKIKNKEYENTNSKIKSFILRVVLVLCLNLIFVTSSMIYTNEKFNKREDKTFKVAIDASNYSYHYSSRGGASYKISITDPKTKDEYTFAIGKREYDTRSYVRRLKTVVVYKGLWGLRYARLK